jgi:uncharacterized protein HemX
MALEQSRAFEKELQMLFMQTGKIDVWNKIKARQAEMDLEDAREISALKKAEKEAKQKEQEEKEIVIAITAISFLLFLVGIGIYELMEFCETSRRCGGR